MRLSANHDGEWAAAVLDKRSAMIRLFLAGGLALISLAQQTVASSSPFGLLFNNNVQLRLPLSGRDVEAYGARGFSRFSRERPVLRHSG